MATILYTVILYPLVQIIEIAFKLFDKLFDNTGIAVIGVSLTVTLLCLPLYIVAEHWQQVQRDTEKKLKNNVDRIKSVFKGDEQYMILSAFYRQNHYHPIMALRSSFGLLIQIPFFMAAYSCLSSLPSLQGESFWFIRDMGKPDAVFYIGSFAVNILPIAMTVINIIAGAIYTKGFPVKEKFQIYGMALIFLALLYDSPAGLVLYWTMNNVFSLVKNIFYKLKNPIKVLYYIMCAGVVGAALFILFVYSGGASMTKRLSVVIPLLFLLCIPLVVRFVNYLFTSLLTLIVNDSKKRFLLFVFSAAGLCVLFGLVIPSSIITSSVQEFSNIESFTNPLVFFKSSFWQSVGLFVFWPLCVYFLFREKIQTLISVLFPLVLICGMVNAYVFPGDYGSMDTTLKFIGGMSNPNGSYILVNTIVLIALSVAFFFLISKKNGVQILVPVTLISGISFMILGFLNLHTINSEYKAFSSAIADNKAIVNDFTTQFYFSKKEKNVVLIMLDRSESSYMESILTDQPDLYDMYSGFTFYKNALSFNGHTLLGSPGIYGGYEYTPYSMNLRSDIPIKQKHNEALLVLPRLFTEQANAVATLTDLSWGNLSYVSDMSFVKGMQNIDGKTLCGRYTADFKKEILKDTDANTLGKSIQRNLIWISIFRTAPTFLRPAVYYKGSWWASENVQDMDAIIDWYAVLHYLPQITDFTADTNTLTVMTNEATHSSERIADLGLLPSNVSSAPDAPGYDTNMLCLLSIGRWLNVLKENGCYDNTRVIIVADHGIGYGPFSKTGFDVTEIGGYAKDHMHPLFLFKDFNAKGHLVVDDTTFMTNADAPSLLLQGIVDNPKNPFTGNDIDMKEKEDGVFVTIDNLFMPHHSKSKYVYTVSDESWYKVRDDIFKSENWQQEVPTSR